jgi:hypothetical protein
MDAQPGVEHGIPVVQAQAQIHGLSNFQSKLGNLQLRWILSMMMKVSATWLVTLAGQSKNQRLLQVKSRRLLLKFGPN